MALDRIYQLFPDADTQDADAVSLWVEHHPRSQLATVGEAIDQGDVLYVPRSTIVIRIRYREDVTAGVSRFRDRSARVWRVGETVEVGRRQWLDCAISTYDIPGEGGAVVPSGFIPPPGWFLQNRKVGGQDVYATSGNYVDTLVVRATRISGDNFLEFDVTIPSPGWAVARGLLAWHGGGGAFGTTIPATSPGSTITGIGTRPESARMVSVNNFDAGTAFPSATESVFVAIGSGFAIVSLSPGATIQITPGI